MLSFCDLNLWCLITFCLEVRPEGKRTLGKPRCRWGGWEVVDWMHLAQDMDQWRAAANRLLNLRVP